MSNPRVLRMNELSSTRYDDVPLPVRQQLGDFSEKVDVDARSGNGIRDYDLRRETDARDYDKLDPERNGHTVLPVTYHLDSSEPNAEPAAGPGTRSYNLSQVREPLKGSNAYLHTQGNATLATQRETEYVSTQREIPGRNERYSAAVGGEDHASAAAGSGHAAVVYPSASIADSDDEVPTGTIASVKSWVGQDRDRAQRALDAEQGRETPRNSLVEWLQDRLDTESDSE